MNQIPNIEEWKKLARERLAPNVTYIDPKFKEVASWAEELLNAFWVEQQKDLDAFIDTLHHQLQKRYERGVQDELNRESKNMDVVIAGMLHKARQSWLQEEIVSLEAGKLGLELDMTIPQINSYNDALQTIIDRYQEELDQDKI